MSEKQDAVRQLYKSRIKELNKVNDGLLNKVNLLSWLRLILFVSLIIFLWRFTNLSWTVYLSISAVLAVLFLYIIKIHERFKRRNTHQEVLLKINKEELRYLDFDFGHAYDGEEFKNEHHPYTDDLDIFGKGSLFQYINRTVKKRPARFLADILSKIPDKKTVPQRQEMVNELRENVEWRQHFQALGRNTNQKTGDINNLLKWLEEPSPLKFGLFLKSLLILMPLISVTVLILSIFFLPIAWILAVVLLQLSIIKIYSKSIQKTHDDTGQVVQTLQEYIERISFVEKANFKSEHLKKIQQDFLDTSGTGSASLQINGLSRVLNFFDLRLHMLLNIAFNGLLLWDLQCLFMLKRWKEKNRNNLAKWFDDIDFIEAFASLGTFAYNHPEFTYPTLSEADFHLTFKELSHPLIESSKRVSNSVEVSGKGNILLITGSNMAGKSTFLRAAGINMVLANTGAPVCATEFAYSPSEIYTSMRIKDSLESETSTFYAELKRLKSILEKLKEGRPVFILLDEILKGTNSKDKLTGSRAYIVQLSESYAYGMVATHDLDLGVLETALPGKVFNYSFEVQIKNDSFEYDYKLKRGVCKTLNATELMKQMGIKIE
ncbi:MAG: hypothetical protein EA412_02065 [Chitinophagaceae bacterium]|nr:MAG: hypothetical protein EA412_02065 [Chitinophagaceae bacterium]